ncbi:hypothetical protein [Methylobacterium nigriterrae]|uniref:hypothetical protein n=1 Tax=Methylobacterium nigriterrae TaxID=3127512 RepID=UPI0030138BB4
MKPIAYMFAGALTLSAGLAIGTAPASADEPAVYSHRTYQGRPVLRYRAAHQPRRIVRTVIVERPVYRTRRVVREVVVERPVIYRPPPVVREVVVEPFDDGPPPYVYGPPFRRRFAYGAGFYGPIRPAGFGFGPRFGYGPDFW